MCFKRLISGAKMIYTGTAAWNIPVIAKDFFPFKGSHLERYASKLNAVEINTSFYRDHQAKTYLKWAEMTPYDFRFSVKLNRRFTHESNLEIDIADLHQCLSSISLLGEKMGVLLIQFPIKQLFDREKMYLFYRAIRQVYHGAIALEARNTTWSSENSLELIKKNNISVVKADPDLCPIIQAGEIEYLKLHGSPEIYKSNYSDEFLNRLFSEIEIIEKDVWCIFDNTTFGHATINALSVTSMAEKVS